MEAVEQLRELELHVVDRGRGIDPERLTSIFGAFEQGAHPLARSRGGLGLELAIAKSLVELHGGRLHATSDGLGLGSDFCLVLPWLQSRSPQGILQP